jgi:hypothetical protein
MTVGRGTARFDEQDDGLHVEADAPNTSWCRDLIESMKRGDIVRMSAGFFLADESWSTERGQLIRTVKSGILIEASVVNRAAYPTTQAGVQDYEEQGDQDEDDGELEELWAAGATNHQPLSGLALRSARGRFQRPHETDLARASRELAELRERLAPLTDLDRARLEIARLR